MEFTTGQIRPIEVYKEAWELMSGEFWMIFGIVLVGIIVGGIIPVIIMGPMMCGVFLCLIDKVDGKPASFDKLFKGFDYFVPGLIVSLIIMVPVFVFIFAVYIPMIAISIAGPRMSEEELWPFIFSIIAVELVIGILMTLIHSFLIFAFPLIVDKNLGGFQAVRTSIRAVWANKAGVGGLFAVGILVAIVGYALLCIGIYLAIPVILMATTVAYRKVFPRAEGTLNFEPPPPTAYQGL